MKVRKLSEKKHKFLSDLKISICSKIIFMFNIFLPGLQASTASLIPVIQSSLVGGCMISMSYISGSLSDVEMRCRAFVLPPVFSRAIRVLTGTTLG